MKRFNFKCFYMLLLVTAFQSCTKDMDVISEDDDVLSPEVLFSTQAGYKQALAGVYGNLSLTGTDGSGSSFLQGIDAGTSQFARCLWYLQNLTTDEAVWSYENDAGIRELQRNTWTAENPLILGMFSRTMGEVALANEFLRQSTPDKLSQRGLNDAAFLADVVKYRNEVRVLRAYAYYNLMDLFGKAPFITENDPLNFRGPQYDRAQLFAFVESELIAVLPNLNAPRTNEYGRLDQAVARMILAKMYLNAEIYIQANRYNDCITQCNEIIAGGYTLKPNYLDNFKADNHTSAEIIFTLQSDGQVTQNYGATTIIVNGQVGSIENNGSEFGVGGFGGALRLRKQFVQKFDGPEFNSDTRKTIFSGSRSIDITSIPNAAQGYILKKYSNKTAAGVPGPSSTFVDTDFPLFRLADVYLMYVEAQMRKDGAVNGGNTTNATSQSVQYINLLRQRANNGSTAANVSSSDVTLNFILDERARELHWEGHRRQDLIRFNKYTGGAYNWAWKGDIANGTSISDNLKVFPIPSGSLSANSNLTQNTGY